MTTPKLTVSEFTAGLGLNHAVLVGVLIWNKYFQRNFQHRFYEAQKIETKDS